MVFADTSFWIALCSKRDQFHAAALLWAHHCASRKDDVVTTEATLWEWLNSTTRATAVEGYRRVHRDPQIIVVAFDGDLIAQAVTLYQAREDKDWSLTDCLSFLVMTQRQIDGALTSDHHFQQAGFRSLLRETPPTASAI
jgi:predicted nucleic acid-binding protein